MFNEYNGSQWLAKGGIAFQQSLSRDPKTDMLMIRMLWSQDSFVDTKYALKNIHTMLVKGELARDLFAYNLDLPEQAFDWFASVREFIDDAHNKQGLESLLGDSNGQPSLAQQMLAYMIDRFDKVNTHMLIDVNWSPRPNGETLPKCELAPMTLADQMLTYLAGILLPVAINLYSGKIRSACSFFQILYPETFSEQDGDFKGDFRKIIMSLPEDVVISPIEKRVPKNLLNITKSIVLFLRMYHPDPPLIGSRDEQEAEDIVI